MMPGGHELADEFKTKHSAVNRCMWSALIHMVTQPLLMNSQRPGHDRRQPSGILHVQIYESCQSSWLSGYCVS